jgi:hypothetical protein
MSHGSTIRWRIDRFNQAAYIRMRMVNWRAVIERASRCYAGGSDMNKWVLAAGALSLITLGVHIFAGGPEVHDAMLALSTAFPSVLQAFISVMWHAITVILAINSVALLLAARYSPSQKTLVWFVVSQYIAFAALAIFYGVLRLGSILIMPQWIAFVLISGLAIAGLRTSPNKLPH